MSTESTESHKITVSGFPVQIIRKDIKNLHLGVYPPLGRVRVAAPLSVSDSAIRLAVIHKLGWIKRQKKQFAAQPRQSAREMVSGETHYFQGRAHRLRVVEVEKGASVTLKNRSTILMRVSVGSTVSQREHMLQEWYRDQLKAAIPILVKKWERVLDVKLAEWGIRKMKTKWGSCNISARRIWLNLELAKKPVQSLEYLVVHELVHLIERRHNARFVAVMDKKMPKWRLYRQELNSQPLGYEDWRY